MGILEVPKSFSVNSHNMRLMLYTLFGLITADGLITQFLVTNGHALEVNPFLQAWVGQDVFLAIKVLGAFLATSLLWIKYTKKPKITYMFTLAFRIFYTTIVSWNLFVFLTT